MEAPHHISRYLSSYEWYPHRLQVPENLRDMTANLPDCSHYGIHTTVAEVGLCRDTKVLERRLMQAGDSACPATDAE